MPVTSVRPDFHPPALRFHRREPARTVGADIPALRDSDADTFAHALGGADREGSVQPGENPFIKESDEDLCDGPSVRPSTLPLTVRCPLQSASG